MKGIKNPMFGKCGKENSMFGKKHDAETKAAISKNHTDVSGKNNPMYGKTQSEETLKLMRESHKNRPILKCPHCGGEFTSAMYNRWHGDKCKKRGS